MIPTSQIVTIRSTNLRTTNKIVLEHTPDANTNMCLWRKVVHMCMLCSRGSVGNFLEWTVDSSLCIKKSIFALSGGDVMSRKIINPNFHEYPPGNWHIPPWEKEIHLQNAIFGGYVSSLEGIFYMEAFKVVTGTPPLKSGTSVLPTGRDS